MLDLLHEKASSQGIVKLKARNNKLVSLKFLTSSNLNGSSAQASKLNGELMAVLEVQGNGNVGERIAQLLRKPAISRIAREELSIQCNLGVKATVDLSIAGKFTREQLRIIQSTGIRLANEEEIKAEEELRQIPMTTAKLLLEIKTARENEDIIFENGKKFAKRFVSTAPLKAAVSKFFSKEADMKWDNIPHNHVSKANPKVLRKIQMLQQTERQMTKLTNLLEVKPTLRTEIMAALDR